MGKRKSKSKAKTLKTDPIVDEEENSNEMTANDSVISQIDDIEIKSAEMTADVIDEIEESNPQLDMEIADTPSEAFVVDDEDDYEDDGAEDVEKLSNSIDDVVLNDTNTKTELSDINIEGCVSDTNEAGSAHSLIVDASINSIDQEKTKFTNNTTDNIDANTESVDEFRTNVSDINTIQTPVNDQASLNMDEPIEHEEEPQLKLQPSSIPNDRDGPPTTSEASETSETHQSEERLFIPPVYKYMKHPNAELELNNLMHDFAFSLCVVDFDHLKGPEIQYWIDDDLVNANELQRDEVNQEKISMYSKIWPHLPFEALPDGAHLYDETFTYFTLNYDAKWNRVVELPYEKLDTTDDPTINVTEALSNGAQIVELENPYETVVTLFGCGCIRQLDSSVLKTHDENVKRGTIQKSVVLLSREPLPIQLREKLGVVTQSWFEQHEFKDFDILISLWSQIKMYYNEQGYQLKTDDIYDDIEIPISAVPKENNQKIIRESDIYMGLNFQQVVLKLKRNLLVIFKALILGNYKILVFSKDLNALSNIQYCLVGLIPTMLLSLQDSGFPLLDRVAQQWTKSSSLKSSDRQSILNFIGLPLPIFSKGAMFQPYMTLQQLDYLSNENTESFMIGASNDILLERKLDWFDVVIYLDEQETGLFGSGACKIDIFNKELKDITSLTSDDKRFIDLIINDVDKHEISQSEEQASDDEQTKLSKTVNHNPSIENGHYKGGDDFIRSQFEDYIIGMLSTIKYDQFLKKHAEAGNDAIFKQLGLDSFSNDIAKFNLKFVAKFKSSRVGLHWDLNTEDELFNFFEPRHVGIDAAKKDNMFSQLFSKKSPAPQENLHAEETTKGRVSEDTPIAVTNQLNSFGKEVGGFFKRLSVKTESEAKEAENLTVTETEAVPPKDEPVESQESAGHKGEVTGTPKTAGEKLRVFFGW